MTQAPIYTIYFQLGNKTQTKEDIFNNITEKLNKGFPVGTGTPKGTEEVEGHAYAIVGTYDLNLKSGENLKLIKPQNAWKKYTMFLQWWKKVQSLP